MKSNINFNITNYVFVLVKILNLCHEYLIIERVLLAKIYICVCMCKILNNVLYLIKFYNRM